MAQPHKLRAYVCPLGKAETKGGFSADDKPKIQGRYCLNSCSEYKNNKCPRFPHTW